MGTSPYSRRVLRRRFRAWVVAHRRLVIGLSMGAVAFLVLETAMLTSVADNEPLLWYVLGVTHTMIVGSVVFGIATGFVASDPDAIRQLRGAWGEENTRDELRRAKRKRLVWGCVDSIELAAGDIDHLVVTRRGGLVAIDSKWRNTFDASDRERMAAAGARARLRAQGVVQTLFARERRGSRSSGSSIRVRPVIVVWGALQHEIPAGASFGGVDFVPGQHLISWLKRLDGDPIDARAARELLHRIESFRESVTAP